MKSYFEHNAELRQLAEKMNGTNDNEIIEQMNQLEREYKQARKLELLCNVNAEQKRKREIAREAWEAEETTEDITTADGSLHKVKARKYPKLASIPYMQVTEVKDGKIIEMRINGERLVMYSAKYQYGQPTIYTRPASFDDFLDLNNIPKTEITIEEYETTAAKLDELKKQVKAAMDAYKAEVDKLNVYSLQNWGLASQSPEHFYTYSLNQ